MTIPQNIEAIASRINASVTKHDRDTLAMYLSTVRSDDDLFLRCVWRAVMALQRFSSIDQKWLSKWIPIIFHELEGKKRRLQ